MNVKTAERGEKKRAGERKRERERESKRERKMGGVCPGLPFPSSVHLVTHPLHRAQYMTDWQRAKERERGREGERERRREREGERAR